MNRVAITLNQHNDVVRVSSDEPIEFYFVCPHLPHDRVYLYGAVKVGPQHVRGAILPIRLRVLGTPRCGPDGSGLPLWRAALLPEPRREHLLRLPNLVHDLEDRSIIRSGGTQEFLDLHPCVGPCRAACPEFGQPCKGPIAFAVARGEFQVRAKAAGQVRIIRHRSS
jgi:hypothetical protein